MKRILHIPGCYTPLPEEFEDVCLTIVNHLATLPGVEQRIFRSTAPRYLDRLRRELCRFRPGFVHLHAPNPVAAVCLPAALPAGVKLIVHWHSDIPDPRNLYNLVKPFERALLRRADVIVATSLRYIEGSKVLGPFREKCVVIPGVVDASRLAPHTSRLDQIRWRYGDKPLLLFVGRHVPHKGLGHLLAAIPLVSHDCRVVVGGTGPLTEHLKRDNRSEKIHFMGRIPDGDLAAWYTAADIFLYPSVTRSETFGTALAEAMWCGTPAVTFTVEGSGVNWVNLNGVTGIEVDNGNEEQLAAAIDHLLAHDEMRREYGDAARRRIEEHMTLERVAPALEALYA